jgi:deoxycytidine triphosphate deaminase
MPIQLLDIEPASTESDAIARAEKFKQVDPFPDILPALLSSADIEDYVRVTAMLHPFHPDPQSLKPASYEVRPGRKFIRWNDDGQRIEQDVREDGTYELPPNSISFMQIEPKIRLPDYIAIRFNLRITHVHRGLLLGTGPLVDPGFAGDILIPLHNLTSESYRIPGDEGLIWIEFTKTVAGVTKADPAYLRRGIFRSMEARKTDRSVDYYFQRANGGRPIRSSIPEAVKNAATKAEEAAASAADARQAAIRTGLIYSGIGGVAALALIVTLIVGLHQYFGQVYASVQASLSLASTVLNTADQAKADASRAIEDTQIIRRDLEATKAQIEDLRGQLGTMTRELERLRQQAPAPVLPSRK